MTTIPKLRMRESGYQTKYDYIPILSNYPTLVKGLQLMQENVPIMYARTLCNIHHFHMPPKSFNQGIPHPSRSLCFPLAMEIQQFHSKSMINSQNSTAHFLSRNIDHSQLSNSICVMKGNIVCVPCSIHSCIRVLQHAYQLDPIEPIIRIIYLDSMNFYPVFLKKFIVMVRQYDISLSQVLTGYEWPFVNVSHILHKLYQIISFTITSNCETGHSLMLIIYTPKFKLLIDVSASSFFYNLTLKLAPAETQVICACICLWWVASVINSFIGESLLMPLIHVQMLLYVKPGKLLFSQHLKFTLPLITSSCSLSPAVPIQLLGNNVSLLDLLLSMATPLPASHYIAQDTHAYFFNNLNQNALHQTGNWSHTSHFPSINITFPQYRLSTHPLPSPPPPPHPYAPADANWHFSCALPARAHLVPCIPHAGSIPTGHFNFFNPPVLPFLKLIAGGTLLPPPPPLPPTLIPPCPSRFNPKLTATIPIVYHHSGNQSHTHPITDFSSSDISLLMTQWFQFPNCGYIYPLIPLANTPRKPSFNVQLCFMTRRCCSDILRIYLQLMLKWGHLHPISEPQIGAPATLGGGVG
ncbi:hypothetical protein VP01_3453g2 [Puccinia sorghi]|uniref:Uncharacterized protein n=1 Tax=Puccinia sorghi TaxID=27349 RepID=A0A0L6UW64_9BASI|nr:hypothetical protein VP01_3453g2 [Puccinia sorghi]